MLRVLRWLGEHATFVLPACLAAGLLVGPWFAGLSDWLAEMIIVLFAISLLDADTSNVRQELRHAAWLPLGALALLMAAPLLAHLAAGALHLSATEHAGLVLMLCAPPLTITGNFARLAGTQATPGLVIMVTLSLAALATVPWLATGLQLGGTVDAGALAARLAYILGGGLTLALVGRRLIPPATRARRVRELDGLSAIVLALFLFAVLATGAQEVLAHPTLALRNLAVGAGGMGTMLALTVGTLALAGVAPGRTLAWGLCGGCRNLALVLAALPLAQSEPLFLYLVMVQVPIYLAPLVAKVTYRLLLRRQAA